MTLPVIVVLALVLASLSGTSAPSSSASSASTALGPVDVSAPPSDPTTVAPCTKVLEALPRQLADLQPRIVHSSPDTPFDVAWGNPPVVLRCGVPRPAGLTPNSGDFVLVVDGVSFFQGTSGGAHVFTAVDRAVYVDVTVPASYRQPPLGPLADAIAKALPAVCVPQAAPGQPPVDPNTLCTHRR